MRGSCKYSWLLIGSRYKRSTTGISAFPVVLVFEMSIAAQMFSTWSCGNADEVGVCVGVCVGETIDCEGDGEGVEDLVDDRVGVTSALTIAGTTKAKLNIIRGMLALRGAECK